MGNQKWLLKNTAAAHFIIATAQYFPRQLSELSVFSYVTYLNTL